ncbi:hypothetical protein [Brevundimonas sp.]|uniref:hypothetical protein n=1 Tax=Brevundimonas sp. TaxID=1871086 RepID=UPI0025FCB6D3|nr:hypothetical protein [Brevundimonas sp.]
MVSAISGNASSLTYSAVKSVRKVEEKAVSSLNKAETKVATESAKHGDDSKQAQKAADKLERAEAKATAQLAKVGSSLLSTPAAVNTLAVQERDYVSPQRSERAEVASAQAGLPGVSQGVSRAQDLGQGVVTPGQGGSSGSGNGRALGRVDGLGDGAGRGLALGRQVLEMRRDWLNPARARRASQARSAITWTPEPANRFSTPAFGENRSVAQPRTWRSSDIALSVLSHWAAIRPSLMQSSAGARSGHGAYQRAQDWSHPWRNSAFDRTA